MTDAGNMPSPTLKVTALSVEDAARLIAKCSGKPVSPETIREDVAAGAPMNADGTINMVEYAAWLVKELADRGD